MQSLERLLNEEGHPIRIQDGTLFHSDARLTIKPGVVSVQLLEGSAAQTLTTIEVRHPEAFPEGVFEFQHATGPSAPESIELGLQQWLKGDLPPLLQAVLPGMRTQTIIELQYPAKDDQPARVRQGILGPVAYFSKEQHDQQQAAADSPACDAEGPHPPFCACCLLTNSFEAFKDLFEVDRFFGIRMFAMRDQNGYLDADCRINGIEWDLGKKALRKYALSWPTTGFEFRKQYVVVHTPKEPAMTK